jgi:DNA replicative helicase MCM subunit Mcm2 (Cdc46/Mcm family)
LVTERPSKTHGIRFLVRVDYNGRKATVGTYRTEREARRAERAARNQIDRGTFEPKLRGEAKLELQEAQRIRVRRALEHPRKCSEIKRDPPALELWHQVYPDLSKDYPGMIGALTARAEAHVLRLSMIYALLDCSNVVSVQHLTAALALWQYCEESTRYIFGDRTGDSIADRIRDALRANGPLTETDIRDLFGRHQTSARIQQALELLLITGMAPLETVDTGGRPARKWRASR